MLPLFLKTLSIVSMYKSNLPVSKAIKFPCQFFKDMVTVTVWLLKWSLNLLHLRWNSFWLYKWLVYTKYNRWIAYPCGDLLKYFVKWQMNDHWQTIKSRRFLLLNTLLYQLNILLSESLVFFQAQRSRRSGRTIVDVANWCSPYLVLLFYNFLDREI